MSHMTKEKWIKIFALVGASATGMATAASGNVVEGLGIIAAAFSSSSVFKSS